MAMKKLYETAKEDCMAEKTYVTLAVDGGIATVTISREEALNALNDEVLQQLDGVIAGIESDKNVRVMIMTGAGRSFVAGADIGTQSTMNVAEGRAWGRTGSALFRRIEKLEIPTIAAVNGFALGGGCELAMSFDIIIAGEEAKFGQPEVTLGIPPGFSGTQRLPRKVGAAKAKELIFTGAHIGAQEALAIGLVNKVVPPDALMAEARALAEKIAANAPIALAYCKAAIDRGAQTDIDSGIAIENELFAMAYATEDQKEGMKAFLEKRPAQFKGK